MECIICCDLLYYYSEQPHTALTTKLCIVVTGKNMALSYFTVYSDQLHFVIH